jgi:hypothetical protein
VPHDNVSIVCPVIGMLRCFYRGEESRDMKRRLFLRVLKGEHFYEFHRLCRNLETALIGCCYKTFLDDFEEQYQDYWLQRICAGKMFCSISFLGAMVDIISPFLC